ncbi:hypothetical protein HYX07_03710 [Candidatus Woesearchaeota archaeon]|nr:hypothetical protein [Candidatus Woesearchaeota archaeon]
MRKVIVLANPFAGGGRASREIPVLESRLVRYDIKNYEFFIPESEANLNALVAAQPRDGRLIIGAGGDGTFNLIANELLKNESRAVLGMVNLGTRGDVAKEFGTGTIDEACQAINVGMHTLTDVAALKYDGKGPLHFLGSVSLGFENYVDRELIKFADRFPFMKRYIGLRPVELALGIFYFRKAVKGGEVPVHVKIEHDDGFLEVRTVVAIVNNARYFDGGKIPSPDASPYDGKIDCCLVESVPIPVFLNDYRLLASGRHTSRPEVHIMQSGKLKIDAPDGIGVQVDGEILGKYNELDFSVKPKALRVLVHPNYNKK